MDLLIQAADILHVNGSNTYTNNMRIGKFKTNGALIVKQ